MAKKLDRILNYYKPKKGNLKKCNNYRTISLISHPSKVLLQIILSRLKAQAESIMAEEQAGFRAGRSTTEQILNLRILNEKHIAHNRELHHNFIDFTKAFDRVWHQGLWAVLRKYNISKSLINCIESLYQDAKSAVMCEGTLSSWFNTTRLSVISRVIQHISREHNVRSIADVAVAHGAPTTATVTG